MQEAAVLLQGNMRVRLARGEFRKARAAAEVKQVALELQRARARQRDAKGSTPGVSPPHRVSPHRPQKLGSRQASLLSLLAALARGAFREQGYLRSPHRFALPLHALPLHALPLHVFSSCAMRRTNAETERCAALAQARALKRHARRRR